MKRIALLVLVLIGLGAGAFAVWQHPLHELVAGLPDDEADAESQWKDRFEHLVAQTGGGDALEEALLEAGFDYIMFLRPGTDYESDDFIPPRDVDGVGMGTTMPHGDCMRSLLIREDEGSKELGDSTAFIVDRCEER